MSTAEVRDPACVERWPDCKPGAYDPRCCRFPKSCSCATWQGSPADAPADAAWADLLLVIYNGDGSITPEVGAALARYRTAVHHDSTDDGHLLTEEALRCRCGQTLDVTIDDDGVTHWVCPEHGTVGVLLNEGALDIGILPPGSGDEPPPSL